MSLTNESKKRHKSGQGNALTLVGRVVFACLGACRSLGCSIILEDLTLCCQYGTALRYLVSCLALKWKLRRHAWFWGTMAILAALHVPLILFVPSGYQVGFRIGDCRHRLGGFDPDARDSFCCGGNSWKGRMHLRVPLSASEQGACCWCSWRAVACDQSAGEGRGNRLG